MTLPRPAKRARGDPVDAAGVVAEAVRDRRALRLMTARTARRRPRVRMKPRPKRRPPAGTRSRLTSLRRRRRMGPILRPTGTKPAPRASGTRRCRERLHRIPMRRDWKPKRAGREHALAVWRAQNAPENPCRLGRAIRTGGGEGLPFRRSQATVPSRGSGRGQLMIACCRQSLGDRRGLTNLGRRRRVLDHLRSACGSHLFDRDFSRLHGFGQLAS